MEARARQLFGVGGLTLGVAGVALFGVVLGAACLETPTLTFVQAISDAGGPDSAQVVTVPFDAGGPQQVLDNDGNDAGPDAPPVVLACGTGSVNNCGNCAGFPLACSDDAGNRCVADCTACGGGADTYPCLHCPPNGKLRGQCLPLNGNGKVACSAANRCGCTTSAGCPKVAGSGQACLGADTDAGQCATCGENKTKGVACTTGDGTSATCTFGAAPVCK